MRDDSSFDSSDSAETGVGTFLLILWLVVAVIVLLNLLIALVNDAFSAARVSN